MVEGMSIVVGGPQQLLFGQLLLELSFFQYLLCAGFW